MRISENAPAAKKTNTPVAPNNAISPKRVCQGNSKMFSMISQPAIMPKKSAGKTAAVAVAVSSMRPDVMMVFCDAPTRRMAVESLSRLSWPSAKDAMITGIPPISSSKVAARNIAPMRVSKDFAASNKVSVAMGVMLGKFFAKANCVAVCFSGGRKTAPK